MTLGVDARPNRAWQRMLSGRRLDILDPSPLDVELDDVAHGLARVARWNGQTTGSHAFSVAQHSCLVEAIAVGVAPDLSPADRLAVLLHDAPEYVLGDVVTPLKGALGDAFAAIERRLQAAIHVRFGLPPELPSRHRRLIKAADRTAAFVEATRLAGFSIAEAEGVFGPPIRVTVEAEALVGPMAAEEAGRVFRERVEACLRAQHLRHGGEIEAAPSCSSLAR